MNDRLYINARVVDPVQNIDDVRPVGVKNGRFALPENLENPTVIDLAGYVLCPGFMDVHVHLRDPGQTHKETLFTAAAAAAHGGFTAVLAMPNTSPAMDSPDAVASILGRAEHAPVRVFQAVAFTKGRNGTELTDLPALKAAGAAAFSDDGSTTQSTELMRQAMTLAAKLDMAIIDHCENTALSKPGVMHRGQVSQELGLPGQPREAEEDIVARDIALCRETGCRLHLQHLSSAGSIQLLRDARAQGLPVTGEATPHHLTLTDQACKQYGVNAKMAPPLREESDRQALIQAIADGVITVIATDHAPHTAEEKAAGWTKAPFGIVGIEAAIPLCLTELYHKGRISLPTLVACFTKGPRELLKLPVGSLIPGEPADITLLEPDAEYVIHTDQFLSQGRNCPYDGWHCIGVNRPIPLASR